MNLTIEPEQLGMLSKLAKRRKLSLSATALALITDALENQEDIHFSELGDKILSSTKRWVPHDKAWSS